jgi:hypothetical protein
MTPADDPHVREPGGPGWATPAPRPPDADDDDPKRAALDDDDFGPGGRLRSRAGREDDERYLRLLSIFHYIVGGLIALCSTLPVFHFAIGIGLVTGGFPAAGSGGPPPPAAMGWMFVIVAGAMIVFGWSVAIGLMIAGQFLSKRRHYVYCLVMAGLACMFQPFGVMLGVFTFIVLLRPGVKELFGRVVK